ncbi:MAG TPA: hypothetical protein VLA12_10085 [Planctomycetaceae bacterium]|nr:hypothetical protein [Planctomycetaceae bacterium]
MPDHSALKLFDVHLFPVVRIKVSGVAATSQREAIETALVQTDLHAHFSDSDGEFAEELSHFLVDVVGDEEYEQSRWYFSRETPVIANLARLVAWHDRGCPEIELPSIVRDARDILNNSL